MIGKALIKDSAVYGGADFVSKLLAFIAFPIVASVLDPSAFGALELIFTSIALSGVIVIAVLITLCNVIIGTRMCPYRCSQHL